MPIVSVGASRTLNVALIASFTAAAVSTRVLLAAFPNIKPTSFLTAMTGILFGPWIGFAVGLLTIVVTDMLPFFGVGFHTFVTAPCMGAIGLASGLLWSGRQDLSRFELAVGGFFMTFAYDIVTSLLGYVLFLPNPGVALISALVGLYLPTPYPMGPAHEFSTALLMGFLGVPIAKAIRRRRGW
ncbi:MAG: ECF transporter S component [Candidatus Bathyarchaeia archaeon]